VALCKGPDGNRFGLAEFVRRAPLTKITADKVATEA